MANGVYQSMELSNKPCGCNIVIVLKSNVYELPSGMTSILIKRKKQSDLYWSTIGEQALSSVDDLNVIFEDRNTISGVEYTYAAIPVIDGKEGVGVSDTIKCSFQGWYIADKTGEYVVGLNVKTSKKKNTALSYIQTLASPYPYAVSNGKLNYFSGTFTGLFLPMKDGKFTREGAFTYKEKVIEFLSNGFSKIIKSGEGEAMKIRVDEAVDLAQSDFLDANEISFTYTQIGDFPATGLVKIE